MQAWYLVLNHRAVRICVEHNDGIRQHIGYIGRGKNVGVVFAELFGKFFHDAIDLPWEQM